MAKGEYHADGTGVLHEWGASFLENLEVEGENQICITVGPQTKCYEFERNTAEADLYRARDVADGPAASSSGSTDGSAVATGGRKEVGPGGGAATASAEELAAELANPNTPMGTLNTNFDYIAFDGDLPEAGDQSALKMTFQPSLPYPLGGGTNFFVRPAIPIIFDQSVPSPSVTSSPRASSWVTSGSMLRLRFQLQEGGRRQCGDRGPGGYDADRHR